MAGWLPGKKEEDLGIYVTVTALPFPYFPLADRPLMATPPPPPLLLCQCPLGMRFSGLKSNLCDLPACDLWPQICHVELPLWPQPSLA